ncbi:MAG: bifunctional ornithine acetyltransferase/N-acetylglutamate synthase, partial [Clostridiales bacterium]|nr:bifunctional ornithine acetyltransferase/N-acetylglutamate synthase [Clostridiales bacterium]
MENSGVTFPQGFLAAGISAGIKKSGKPDFAIVFSEFPATVAAVYTTNKVKAAPVVRDKQITDNGGKIKAIVINSGNANACTGEQGTIDAQKTAVLVAKELSCLPEEVLTCSTGVIGVT